MTRIRTATTCAAVAAVSALLLAGCSPDASTPADGDVIELTFWHGYTEADGAVLEQIVADFNDQNADVQISTEVNPWAVIDDTLLPALSAGTGPDIVAMPAERLPVYADRGAFASLDDFYADPANNGTAVNPGAVDMITVNGSAYGVPTGFVPLAVYYNTALFEAAGITEVPETWDAWVAVAQQLTIDENNDGTPEQYGVIIPDHQTVANGLWPSLFYGNGGDIVVNGDTVVIDSPENAETLAFWRDAITESKISPTGVNGIEADGIFSSGRAAMTIGGPWMVFIAADNDIDYGIAPIPAGPADQAASAIGVSMAITQQADENRQAAAERFFAFFLNDDNAVAWSLGSGWPPLRTDVAADAVAENPTVAALTAMAEFGRPLLPGVVNSVDVLSAVDDLTQRVMAGGDIDALLAEAQQRIEAAVGR